MVISFGGSGNNAYLCNIKREKGMKATDPNDLFYTPEVIADIRKSILMRIGKDTDVHRLERIQDLLTPKSFATVIMSEDTMSAGEPAAAYYTRRDVDFLRKRLQQQASSCGLDMMEEIFSYYDHDGMTFKDAYLDAKASTITMYPSDAVEELAEVNFMIDRDPEPDDWHEPQTPEEWVALDRELNEATDYISGDEFWRHFEKMVS